MNPPVKNTTISIIETLNNGTLSGKGAMPQKDGSADGESTFSMGRHVYLRSTSINGPPHLPTLNQGWRSSYKQLEPPRQTTVQPINKKWMGSTSRDASRVAIDRRNHAIGKGSSVPQNNGKLSFETHSDPNLVNRRVKYVRSGGAVVPPKCTANRNNRIVPGYKPEIMADGLQGVKSPYLYH